MYDYNFSLYIVNIGNLYTNYKSIVNLILINPYNYTKSM